MNILIAYSSRTGTARLCATLLGSHLKNHNVSYADLSVASPDPSKYDAVILGTSIRMSRAGRPFTQYLRDHKKALLERTLGFYICAANSEDDEIDFYIQKNIPEKFIKSAFCISYFGGELNRDRARGLDKLLVRFMRSSYSEISEDSDTETRKTLPTIAEPVIAQFADGLKNELIKNAQKTEE